MFSKVWERGCCLTPNQEESTLYYLPIVSHRDKNLILQGERGKNGEMFLFVRPVESAETNEVQKKHMTRMCEYGPGTTS